MLRGPLTILYEIFETPSAGHVTCYKPCDYNPKLETRDLVLVSILSRHGTQYPLSLSLLVYISSAPAPQFTLFLVQFPPTTRFIFL